MKRVLWLVFCCACLRGNIDLEGKMFLVITDVFSIVLDARTLSYGFTSQDITDNATQKIPMGTGGEDTITVTINDNTTTPDGTNQVLFYSLFSDAGTVQLIRQNNSVGNQGGIQPRIDLVVTDSRDNTGAANPTEIDSGDSIRNRTRQTDPAIVNEDHEISFEAAIGSLDASNPGNYRTLVYFSLVVNT